MKAEPKLLIHRCGKVFFIYKPTPKQCLTPGLVRMHMYALESLSPFDQLNCSIFFRDFTNSFFFFFFTTTFQRARGPLPYQFFISSFGMRSSLNDDSFFPRFFFSIFIVRGKGFSRRNIFNLVIYSTEEQIRKSFVFNIVVLVENF